MTDYTKSTNFTIKDNLPSGDTGKIVRGSEIDTEFNNIATSVNSKANKDSPTFTGTITAGNLTASGTLNAAGTLQVGGVAVGTAATADVTISPTDTTPDRLLKVGDFGLGEKVPEVTGNLNDALTVGFYNYTAWSTNLPPEAAGYKVMVVARAAGDAAQLAFKNSGTAESKMFVREYSANASAWSAWRQVYHQGSILGTVSQSAGVPTGAVIESGSNANGEYVKFADGTMICTYTINVTTSSGTDSFATWTYPAAFISTTNLSAQATVNTALPSRFRSAVGAGSSASSATIYVFDSSGSTTVPVRVLAVGRWF